MQSLDRTGINAAYTPQFVANLLSHASSNLQRGWRFNILNFTGSTWTYKGDLTSFVTQAIITHDSTQAVKRTMTLTMAETAADLTVDVNGTRISQANINYYYDWVQPVYRIKVPDGTGTILEFPLGVFSFMNPQTLLAGYMVQRQLQLGDATYTLSRAMSTTAPTSSNGTANAAVYSNPIQIPQTDPQWGGTITLVEVIVALLTNAPDSLFDPNRPIESLPGAGFDPSMLDQNIFGSRYLPGGSRCVHAGSSYNTTPTFDALVPSPYQINVGSGFLDTINTFLKYLNCDDLWVTEGALCNSGGQIGNGQGGQNTVNGVNGLSNGPIFTTERWPQFQNYNSASVYPSYAYSTEQGVNNSVSVKTVDILSGAYNSGNPISLTFANSVVLPGTTESLGIDQIANVINVVIEDSSRDAYVATLTNTDPNSPFSVQNLGRRVVKMVNDSGIPAPGLSSLTDWAKGIAYYEMSLADAAVDNVALLTAVNPCHQNRDVVALNIYADYVGGGVVNHFPLLVGDNLGTGVPLVPGLTIAQKFLELGWEINIVLPTPGSGTDIPGTGVTTAIEARGTKPGATMKHTLQRVTALCPDPNSTIYTTSS